MNQNYEKNMFFISKNLYRVMLLIEEITARGNDAEVRRRPDGTYVVYEIIKCLVK